VDIGIMSCLKDSKGSRDKRGGRTLYKLDPNPQDEWSFGVKAEFDSHIYTPQHAKLFQNQVNNCGWVSCLTVSKRTEGKNSFSRRLSRSSTIFEGEVIQRLPIRLATSLEIR